MPISIDEFWKLAVASGLVSPESCQKLQAAFGAMKGAGNQPGAATLAEWLIAQGALSRYQASVLLSGRPGPFVFGDFVIVERIETGRLARTFRAVYKKTQPALLMFASAIADDPRQTRSAIERFEAAKAVKSPHVSRVYQLITATAPPFFVIEDLQGQTLRDHLSASKPTVGEACRIGFQAAMALVALQERHAVHGNICPENLWVDPSGTIKLLQFPLSDPANGNDRFKAPAIDYLAPELADANRPADAVSDVYSLGCVLYELFAGRVPFPSDAMRKKLERHRGEVPQRLDQLAAEVNEDVATLVAEMLDKEPMIRAQTASHVAHLLAPFASGQSERRAGSPPRLETERLAPGYGAWREPGWQSPPKQTQAPRPTPAPAPTPVVMATPIPTPQPATAPAKTAEREVPIIVVDAQVDQPSAVAPARAPLVKRQRTNTTLIGAGAGLAVVAVVVVAGVLLANRGDSVPARVPTANLGATDKNRPNPPVATRNAKDSPAPQPNRGNSPSGTTSEIDDDGQSLWASPTAGQPLSLRYVPSGAQVILALRPAEILTHAEGAKVLDALGPAAQLAIDRLQSTLGVPLARIEQLTIAFVPDESGAPQAAYTMRLVEPVLEQSLLPAWGKPRATEHKSKPYYVGAQLAYYLPADGQARMVAIAPPALMREVIERDSEPLLRKAIEELRRTTDDARHFNLLAAPSYLLTDGKTLLAGDLAKLRDPLARFFDMSVQAVLASATVGEELFGELRVVTPADQRPEELAAQLRARLESAAGQLEQYVASLAPRPYGRLVINRFPRMVQLAGNFTRAGAEGRQAVLRAYLPASALHNLVLGAELALFEEPATTDPPPAGVPTTPNASGAAAALDKKISLSFPRDTLEKSMEMLAGEIGIPIVILGPDLQLDGITKNQSFGLDERDRPARDILHKILQLSNPDGKLIYVIKPGDSGEEALFITTRAAAAKRGDRLPPEFDAKTPAKKP